MIFRFMVLDSSAMLLGEALLGRAPLIRLSPLNASLQSRARSGTSRPMAKAGSKNRWSSRPPPPARAVRASNPARRANWSDFVIREVPHDLLKPLDMLNPARHFPLARRLRRDVHLHIGPTNSGKSYTALQAFKAAESGFYAGPLRMLAREIYDRMEIEGIPCNLVTGDEVLEKPDARLNSGTVEMMDLSREMDVAVIDEIQMIEDADRGWAWSRAFLGVRAQTVHLCGDPNSEKFIAEMAKQTGDKLTIHRYERLSPLMLEKGLNAPGVNAKKRPDPGKKSLYKLVQPGDCVVCFSKKQVQAVRDKIVQAHGNQLCCSIVYGSLPPETRAEQARLFNTPGNGVDFLVASDAIGMGLNLGIKRIIFTTLNKFDGVQMRQLSIPQIKQIAGRAGRYRTADGGEGSEGLVNCLDPRDIAVVRKALAAKSPEIQQGVLMPHSQVIKSAIIGSVAFDHGMRFSSVLSTILDRTLTSNEYIMPRQGGATEIAALFDRVPNLTFEDRLALANAPVPTANPTVSAAFEVMCAAIGEGRSANIVQMFPELMSWLAARTPVAETLEKIHKTITLFLWLSYRFPCNFVDRAGALELKKLCENSFNKMLNSHKALTSSGRASSIQKSAIDSGQDVSTTLRPPQRRAAKKARPKEKRQTKRSQALSM